MHSFKCPTFFLARACLATAAAAWMMGGVASAAGDPPTSQSVMDKQAAKKLTGSEEVPPVDTTASASNTITVSADGVVSGGLATTNIDGTAAHIHLAPAGTNGPVVVTLEKASPDHWEVPIGTVLTPAQVKSFQAGELYVNVHSAAHPDGEIRLQLH
jgi:CHRD domain-containing protein